MISRLLNDSPVNSVQISEKQTNSQQKSLIDCCSVEPKAPYFVEVTLLHGSSCEKPTRKRVLHKILFSLECTVYTRVT